MGSPRKAFGVVSAASLSVLAACSLLTSFDDFTGGANTVNDGSSKDSPAASSSSDATMLDSPSIVVHDDGAVPMCPSGTPSVSSGLLGYYPMEETGGTTIFDCSGNGFDGIAEGTDISHTPGHDGSALLFGGQSGCVVFPTPTPSAINFNGTSPFSVALWARIDAFNAAWPRGYLTGISVNPSLAGWRLSIENSSKSFAFTFAKPDAGGSAQTSTTPISTGAWHHFAVTFIPSVSVVVYLDGKQSSMIAPNTFTPETTALRMGCSGDEQNYLIGALDEVRIYNRVLTQSDITTLAQ